MITLYLWKEKSEYINATREISKNLLFKYRRLYYGIIDGRFMILKKMVW